MLLPAPPSAADVALGLAAQLDVQAEAVRAVATRSALVADTLLWRSQAATAFHRQVLERALALRGTAAALADAAAQLRRYAGALAAVPVPAGTGAGIPGGRTD